MLDRRLIDVLAAAALFAALLGDARALDGVFPDWKGQWVRGNRGTMWDPSKDPGQAQHAPLTPEYEAIYEANQAIQVEGGAGGNPTYSCQSPGMPRMMTLVEPMEIIITPDLTFMRIEYMSTLRRIYTDGRDWPKTIAPSFTGYSIGKWIDEDGDGRYDSLVMETRAVNKGIRTIDSAGMPLHKDGQSVITERVYLDKAKPNVLHDDVTTIDHAFTRAWTVTKNYTREQKAVWTDFVCTEDNHWIVIGDEGYFVSADGYLMPGRKGQSAPDLRYFSRPRD